MMKSTILIAVAIYLGCSISGCGGYGSSTSQTASSLTGNWQFTYVPSEGSSLTVSGTLTQTGSSFSGTMSLTGSCASSGTLSGTISGYSFTGTLTEANPETISVTGTVASNYGTANGTYQVTAASGACAAAMGSSGTWGGTQVSGSSGPYIGIIRSADRIPVQVALNLKSDAGEVSGSATFTHSACLHTMNVAGAQSGVNLKLQGNSGTDDSIVLSGTTDTEGKTLSLHSTVSGACQAESGPGTLTKVQ
jgi:hypothetical protein